MRSIYRNRELSKIGRLLEANISARQQTRMMVIKSGFDTAKYAAPSLPVPHYAKLTLIYRKEKVIPVSESVKLP